MTQQIGTQALETSGGEESWQAFFAASDPTAVRSLDEWTADQLLAEALKRSAEKSSVASTHAVHYANSTGDRD